MKDLNKSIQQIDFVKLQNPVDYDDYRYAGKITANCLSLLEKLVRERTVKSLLELDLIAEEFFLSNNTIPVFKGYCSFPASVCMSVDNENSHQLVHSIPTDYKLQEGDLITFDTGCSFNNGMADSALTCIFGEPKSKQDQSLLLATQECLYLAIKEISIGKQIGVIGDSIFNNARKKGYKVIEKYCGHGISRGEIHSSPTILNRDEVNNGVRIRPGMILAIEPLLTTGSIETIIADDKWTVLTQNISCHIEHSVLVLEDGVEITTHREDEKIDKVIKFQ